MAFLLGLRYSVFTMAFVDELKLYIKAGDGGNGTVSFLREKYRPKGGPAGGDGGRGAHVYIRGVRNSSLLENSRFKNEFIAENGQAGGKKSREGKDGEDLYIDLPVGSVVTNQETGEVFELLNDGQILRILRGGNGGLGNEHFKSSTNQTPQEWTPGKPGEEGNFFIELQLVVDAGFVGFPNAGKSSLINALTNSKSKIGAYAFTTLMPHLGSLYGYTLADIPGIIEGASEGKGLGHKFLRHIKRTKMIIHCIALDEHEDIVAAYETIRKELKSYDESLTKKPHIIVLTKADEVDEKTIAEAKTLLEPKNFHISVTSVLDEASIKALSDTLTNYLDSLIEKPKS